MVAINIDNLRVLRVEFRVVLAKTRVVHNTVGTLVTEFLAIAALVELGLLLDLAFLRNRLLHDRLIVIILQALMLDWRLVTFAKLLNRRLEVSRVVLRAHVLLLVRRILLLEVVFIITGVITFVGILTVVGDLLLLLTNNKNEFIQVIVFP